MRVIAGAARGRRLKELEGLETRPTTDKVKESIFNIVQFDIEGRRVLDLFAGTGQLGCEALSRGAAHVVFVDQRRDCARVIKENAKLVSPEGNWEVLQRDAVDAIGALGGKFGLVFLDPPYRSGLMEKALNAITGIDIVTEHGIIVCETGAEEVLPALPENYEVVKEYRYGKIKLTTIRRK